LSYYWYLDPARQEEFNRNIEALAKGIEGAIQRFRSGVKNSRVIELHDRRTGSAAFQSPSRAFLKQLIFANETNLYLINETFLL
jgi:hypothetical protein